MKDKKLLQFWVQQLVLYFRQIDFKIDPLPTIKADEAIADPDDILISTGSYNHSTKTIVLHINGRHIKDVLRTFCHEMVHHHQNLENPDYMRRIYAGANVYQSEEVKELEKEAYLLGNIHFREFTEKLKDKLSK